jgi:hypothetical protein
VPSSTDTTAISRLRWVICRLRVLLTVPNGANDEKVRS